MTEMDRSAGVDPVRRKSGLDFDRKIRKSNQKWSSYIHVCASDSHKNLVHVDPFKL